MRLLGIPTVIDRLVQQAINQTLTPIYQRQFSPGSYGFRPRRGCHDALRGAQKIIDDGYIYVVDLDLERFFAIYQRQFSPGSYGFRPRRGCHDALRGAQKIIDDGYIYVVDLDLERFFDIVSHSKLIEILSRTIKDGRVISLIHKYLRSGVMNKGMFEASEEGTPQGLRGAQKIIDDGYIYVVDLDLERFFDTVSHSKLIEILSRTIKDGRVISLIHKYLRSGVMNKGMFEASEEGTPQGGPLSPLLSNIMLNELDKELTSRGLPFVRYADDSMIFCKSKRAAKRVKESVTRFIEGKLHLKVNRDKTVVSYVQGVKYLGYSFYVMKGKCQLTVHPRAKSKMKAKLKELTSRSNGWGYAKRKQKLEEYIRGG